MLQERRLHARVQVEVPCMVSGPEGEHPAQVMDISHGGAMLEGTAGLANLGDVLAIEIDTTLSHVSVAGAVVSVLVGPPMRYGVRFEHLDDAQNESIDRLIDEQLRGGGGGERAHARVAKRLAVKCTTTEEFEALMRDVSRGGVGISCEQPLIIGQPVYIEFDVGPELLELAATVTHVRPENDVFFVGLHFASLSSEHQSALEVYLARLTLSG